VQDEQERGQPIRAARSSLRLAPAATGTHCRPGPPVTSSEELLAHGASLGFDDSPGLIDCHVHTALSGDSAATVDACCRAAASAALAGISFTNHVRAPDLVSRSFLDRLTSHRDEVLRCRSIYPELRIGLGVEIDYSPTAEEQIRGWLRNAQEALGEPLDYVLGAIHTLRGRSLIDPSSVALLLSPSPIPRYREYYASIAQAASSRLFDAIAHPGLIAKFSNWLSRPVPFEDYASEAHAFTKTLVDGDVALEINTKGLIHPVGHVYPPVEVLQTYCSRAKERGTLPRVVLGSDAHSTDAVGFGFDVAAAALTAAGVSVAVAFRERRPCFARMAPIDPCRAPDAAVVSGG